MQQEDKHKSWRIVSVVTGTGQAVADSIKSKNDKDKKDDKK
jgi:hypothetical protein